MSPPAPGSGDSWAVRLVDDDPVHPLVAAAGELDAAALNDLSRLITAVSVAGPRQVTLDLSEVTFLDAAVLGAFVAERGRLAERAIDFVLVGVSPAARRLIELCGLTSTLGIEPA